MNRLKQAASRIWGDLTPDEPSPLYLAKLMAAMLICFAIGLTIHFLETGI